MLELQKRLVLRMMRWESCELRTRFVLIFLFLHGFHMFKVLFVVDFNRWLLTIDWVLLHFEILDIHEFWVNRSDSSRWRWRVGCYLNGRRMRTTDFLHTLARIIRFSEHVLGNRSWLSLLESFDAGGNVFNIPSVLSHHLIEFFHLQAYVFVLTGIFHFRFLVDRVQRFKLVFKVWDLLGLAASHGVELFHQLLVLGCHLCQKLVDKAGRILLFDQNIIERRI